MMLSGESGKDKGQESLEAFRKRTHEGEAQTEQARKAARSAMVRLEAEIAEMVRRIGNVVRDTEGNQHDTEH